jgi:hypothetical protein
MTAPRKRGRPPRTITSRDGTEIPLRDIGLTRKQISDCVAMASIPKDVFENRLAMADKVSSIGKARRLLSTQGMVRLACELGTTNRKAPMRDSVPIEDARKALAKLTPDERRVVARELFDVVRREGER